MAVCLNHRILEQVRASHGDVTTLPRLMCHEHPNNIDRSIDLSLTYRVMSANVSNGMRSVGWPPAFVVLVLVVDAVDVVVVAVEAVVVEAVLVEDVVVGVLVVVVDAAVVDVVGDSGCTLRTVERTPTRPERSKKQQSCDQHKSAVLDT
jgi:hypothetical protein